MKSLSRKLGILSQKIGKSLNNASIADVRILRQEIEECLSLQATSDLLVQVRDDPSSLGHYLVFSLLTQRLGTKLGRVMPKIHLGSVMTFLKEIVTEVEEELDRFFTSVGGLDSGKNIALFYLVDHFLGDSRPNVRKTHGVFFTPVQLSSYISTVVPWLSTLLNNNRPLTFIDPSAGTGIFLACVANQLIDHSLPTQLIGQEFLLEPFVHSQILLPSYFKGFRYSLHKGNSLTEENNVIYDLFFHNDPSSAPTHFPIFVGNPPYSGNSTSDDQWIRTLLDPYRNQVNPRDYRNLNDDFLKFLALAHQVVLRVNQGAICFVLNNIFLTAHSFFQVRRRLSEDFDYIFVLDLHGASRRGQRDENVFDIQQGVCILILVRLNPRVVSDNQTSVSYYSVLEGGHHTRKDKLTFLGSLSKEAFPSGVPWSAVRPTPPQYWFYSQTNYPEYDQAWSIVNCRRADVDTTSPTSPSIFGFAKSGLKTEKDYLTLHITQESLRAVLESIAFQSEEEFRSRFGIHQKWGRDWQFDTIKSKVLSLLDDKECLSEKHNLLWDLVQSHFVKQVLYRPFDRRWTFYHKAKGFLAYPRWSLFRHLSDDSNLGLAICLTIPRENPSWAHVFAVKGLAEGGLLSSKTSEWTVIIPLLLRTGDGWRPNFTPEFSQFLNATYIPTPTPKKVLGYIYALLHSPAYRTRYHCQLQTEVRVIFPSNITQLEQLASLGMELVTLHSSVGQQSFEGKSTRLIKYNYRSEKEELWVNGSFVIRPVSQPIWEFKIGSYQVIKKWLSYRKKAGEFIIDELEALVVIIEETITVQEKIDEVWLNNCQLGNN